MATSTALLNKTVKSKVDINGPWKLEIQDRHGHSVITLPREICKAYNLGPDFCSLQLSRGNNALILRVIPKNRAGVLL